MKQAIVKITGITPYGQSRYHATEKLDKETHDAYEKRTWREKMHVNQSGFVFVPPMSFKNCLSECAKFLSIQIPGKGKSTYTKHFEAGIMVSDPMVLAVKKDDVPGLWLHVPSDGRRGGTTRVMKCFPQINNWEGQVAFYILDETITKDVFESHIKQAGQFIGVGFFRPRNNGYWGRFDAELIDFI